MEKTEDKDNSSSKEGKREKLGHGWIEGEGFEAELLGRRGEDRMEKERVKERIKGGKDKEIVNEGMLVIDHGERFAIEAR